MCYQMHKPCGYMQTEISYSQKDKHCVIPLILWESHIGTYGSQIKTQNRIVVARDLGEEEKRSFCLMDSNAQSWKKRVLEMGGSDG